MRRDQARRMIADAVAIFFEAPADAGRSSAKERFAELFGNKDVTLVVSASGYGYKDTMLKVIQDSGIKMRGVTERYVESSASRYTIKTLLDCIIRELGS